MQVGRLAPAPPDNGAGRLGPHVEANPRPVGGERRRESTDECDRAQRDEDAVRRGRRAIGPGRSGAQQDRAPPEVGLLDATEVERRASAARGPIHRRTVDLDLANPRLETARHRAHRHPALEGTAPESAGDDRTAALDAEHPVDREARRPARETAPADPLDERLQGSAELVEAEARHRRDGHDGCAGEDRPFEEGGRRRDDRGGPGGVDRIGLRHDGDPVRDPEGVEQLEMLDGLGARAVVGRNDEQRGVDLAGPDEHVPDELVVARDVDEVELRAVREGHVGIPHVDRHPPPALLGKAVGIDPGERAEQRRLAVIDVPRGPDDDGHGQPRALRTAAARSPSLAGSTVRKSRRTALRLDPADDGRRPAAERGQLAIRRTAGQPERDRRQRLAGQ